MGKLKLDTAVPLADLTPHPRNVRSGDVGAISQSLEAHGQYRPIIVQTGTKHILAGNHTYKAAKALGWQTIAVTWLDVDDDEALRILLVDNRSNDLATYDDHGLADLLTDLMATEQQLAGTGYDPSDLDQLLADLAEPPTFDDDTPPADGPRCDMPCTKYLEFSATVGATVEN
jgi:ParB-like chromosome segregation protein Spo0J